MLLFILSQLWGVRNGLLDGYNCAPKHIASNYYGKNNLMMEHIYFYAPNNVSHTHYHDIDYRKVPNHIPSAFGGEQLLA